MAYVSNQPDLEEEKTNQPNSGQGPVSPAGGGGAVHLAPSSAIAPGGGGSASGSGPAAAGGSFASLDKYLSANQGQAAPLTSKITSSIGDQYNGLDAANNAAISSLNTQVSNAPGYTASNPDILAQEAANPVSFAGDQGNVKNFQSLLTNSYGGPLSAEGTPEYSAQQGAINNAIAAGNQNTTTEAGRKNLLSQNEATPTTGVTALNSAILSQDPNALKSIETAYQPFNNLLGNLNTGAAGVNANISKEQADATSSSKAANDAIASQIGGFNTGVTGALTAAQKNASDQNAQIKADLAAGTASPATLKALGVTQDQWNSLSTADKAAATSQLVRAGGGGQAAANSGTTTIDNTNFLTQNDPNALLSVSNTATPQDYAKAQAFQTLLSGLNLGAPSTVINSSTANQAGTAPTNFNQFDYQTALNTAQQAKTSEVAAAQAYVDALQAGMDQDHAAQIAAKVSSGQTIGNVAALANTTIGLPLRAVEAIPGIGAPISSAVSDAVNTVTSFFCFHPDTLITMENGSQLPIHKIAIGDMTLGGKVLATTRAIGQDFYWYNGIIVTGKHAVKELGVWVRVESSKFGHKFNYLTEVVCSLVTEKHRIYTSGIEFADQYETDLYESLDLDESLQELNKNAKYVG